MDIMYKVTTQHVTPISPWIKNIILITYTFQLNWQNYYYNLLKFQTIFTLGSFTLANQWQNNKISIPLKTYLNDTLLILSVHISFISIFIQCFFFIVFTSWPLLNTETISYTAQNIIILHKIWKIKYKYKLLFSSI